MQTQNIVVWASKTYVA